MLNWSVHGLMLELVKQDDDLMDNAQKAHRKAETQNQYLTSLDPVVEGFGTMFPIAQSAMKTEIERAREDDDMCRGMSRSLRRGDSPDPASCRCLFWGQYHPPCRHISCDWLCGNPITSAQVAGYVERFIGIDAEVILPAWSVLGTSLTPEDEDDVLDPLSGAINEIAVTLNRDQLLTHFEVAGEEIRIAFHHILDQRRRIHSIGTFSVC